MILATSAIQAALRDGAIVCDPAPQRVQGAHVDVTLGIHWWVFTGRNDDILDLSDADPHAYYDHCCDPDRVRIPAHGFILAHTQEAIGTAPGSGLVPMLHTRSTFARWGLSVCTSNAGQGDEGYVSRWTLEIINPHPCPVFIPTGARIGSISFHHLEGAATPYAPGTRYNATLAQWTPMDMLPKLGNW
jgi:deoxycytidine triphosphate deaminase